MSTSWWLDALKNNYENYQKKSFWTEEKETRVSFNPGISANLPSNNWALLDSNLSDRWRNPAFEQLGSVVAQRAEKQNKTKRFSGCLLVKCYHQWLRFGDKFQRKLISSFWELTRKTDNAQELKFALYFCRPWVHDAVTSATDVSSHTNSLFSHRLSILKHLFYSTKESRRPSKTEAINYMYGLDPSIPLLLLSVSIPLSLAVHFGFAWFSCPFLPTPPAPPPKKKHLESY